MVRGRMARGWRVGGVEGGDSKASNDAYKLQRSEWEMSNPRFSDLVPSVHSESVNDSFIKGTARVRCWTTVLELY